MRLKELIKNLNYKRIENFSNCRIKGVSCDSRSIAPGYLFVAIQGEKLDGHKFVHQAIDKGAAAVIIGKDLSFKKKAVKILAADTQGALSRSCALFFGEPAKKLKITGITGTNGKTTVSYLIESILSCAGNSCAVIGTINYRVGSKLCHPVNTTPQADVLQSFLQEVVSLESKYVIMEVSSHALAQRRAEGLDFSSAIFTNLSREHLDYHGSLTNYFHCKASLFERLCGNSWAIVNTDDAWGRRLQKLLRSRRLTYGIERPAQIQAKALSLGINGSRFEVITPKGAIKLQSPFIGRHNVYNVLAAAAWAFVEGIDFAHIAQGVNTCAPVAGRLQRIDWPGEFTVFVDYAHTEDALAKILQALKTACGNKSGSKIILVFGCGGDRDQSKRPRMGKLATELCGHAIITCDNPRSEDPKQIALDIVKGISKTKHNYTIVLDRAEAIAQALALAGRGDIVLIAGKGHESSQIFADRVIPFNDREVVERLLKTRINTNWHTNLHE